MSNPGRQMDVKDLNRMFRRWGLLSRFVATILRSPEVNEIGG